MVLVKTNFSGIPFAKRLCISNIEFNFNELRFFMVKARYFLFLVFFNLSVFAQTKTYPKDDFIPPLNIPLVLSGTFGELRSNHFHSGIDIKTLGREGLPIIAPADGEVYRIKVSPYGYGNALYVRHYNGFSTVYGHLQRFEKGVEMYVRSQQYQKEKFAIELFPPSSKFKFKQGDTIAYSGNSGGSGGPHLHFEIRNTRTEKIINPLLFYNVADSKKPELIDLQLYNFHGDELIESNKYKLLESANGKYNLAGENIITVKGSPAFAIRTFDRLDNAMNKNGVYRIELLIHGNKYYDFEMETFAFAETRYINSHIDYGQKHCCSRTLNKLFLEPNNRLSVYDVNRKMHFPKLEKDSIYDVEVRVSDIKGNTSVLEFKVKGEGGFEDEQVIRQTNLPLFKHAQMNFFKNENVNLILPEGALYKDVYFEYEELLPCSSCFSPVFTLGAREIPIHKYYTLKIKPDFRYDGDKSKLAIASFKDGEIEDFEGGKFENGFVVGRTRQLGDFAVVADTLGPKISPVNFQDKQSIKGKKILKLKITDNFSGIEEYRAEWDGKWILMNYDAKRDLLILDVEKEGLKPGSHKFEISVVDSLNNKSTRIYRLIL